MAANNSTSIDDHVHIIPHQLPSVVLTVTLTSCSLSTFGSLVQIITYYLWKDLRLLSRQLLVYISIADLLAAVSLGYGATQDFHRSSNACIVQAFVSTFATVSSLFWMVALLVYILVTVVTVNPERSERLVKYFHTICWGVPALVVITGLVYKGLGTTHSTLTVGWCWVKVERAADLRLFWILITQKLWEFAVFISLIVLCCIIKVQISRKCRRRDQLGIPKGTVGAMRKVDKKVLFVPVVVILLRIWGTVRFALALQKSRYMHNHILMALQGVGDTGQGFANFVMFCLCTARTREVICAEISEFLNRTFNRLPAVPSSCSKASYSNEETKPLLYGNKRVIDPFAHFDESCASCSASQSSSIKSGQLVHCTLP